MEKDFYLNKIRSLAKKYKKWVLVGSLILKVKNKTVLDIGANIGDTAIFFASRGANKIIGVEPFHRNFNLAKKNIASNNFQDKIYLTRSACSSKNGSVKINPQFDSGIESRMENFQEGEDVPIITIRDIRNIRFTI